MKRGTIKMNLSALLKKALTVILCISTAVCTLTLSWIPVDVQAAGGTVSVNSCLIRGSDVSVSATSSGLPASDDGIFYLIAMQPYDTILTGTKAATAPAAANAAFSFALGKNTAASDLFKKFAVATLQGGVLTQVSNAHYITNPEACAAHTCARNTAGKKGLLIDPVKLNSNELADLGIKQCTYNLPVGSLCTGGGISYQYNGKTYNFNKTIVAQYDYLVPILNKKGIQITMILLNNLTGDLTLIHPLSRNAIANYYAYNTAEQAGVEKLEAAASFIAQRYSNNGHGKIDNWIIGNEVNARNEWNYMNPVDVNTFAGEYAKAVRIFYNGIKSENGNANIYISIDQQWARSSNASLYYSDVSFLNAFNSIVSSEGNIDWHIAVHPYNVPLYDPAVWAQSSYVKHSQGTSYITMQNIDVLSDFMCQKSFLSPSGQVRSILCSEVGYTSFGGENVQAAAVSYAYLQALGNRHIDGIMLSRETDDTGEIAQGLANGLTTTAGTHKMAYDFYKNIDGPNSAAYQSQAAAVISAPSLTGMITVR